MRLTYPRSFFTPPAIDNHYIIKPKLADILINTIKSKNHLISLIAPGGSGKSSIVSYWFNQLEDRNTLWLRIPGNDAKLFPFVNQLYQMLEESTIDFHKLEAKGQQFSTLRPIHALGPILDTLGKIKETIALCLDDLHNLTTKDDLEILKALIQFLPNNICLICTSRLNLENVDAWWGIRNHTKITSEDLVFTKNETKKYITQFGNRWSAEQISSIYNLSKGWIAGVCLGLTLLKKSDTAFEKSNEEGSSLSSDLFIRLIKPLNTDNKDVLLTAALLNEFSQDMLKGYFPNKNISELLKSFMINGFFIEEIDQIEKTYRFHPLVSDGLKGLLTPERRQQIYKRSAGYYLGTGNYIRAGEAIIRYSKEGPIRDDISSMLQDLMHHSIKNGDGYHIIVLSQQLPVSCLVKDTLALCYLLVCFLYIDDFKSINEYMGYIKSVKTKLWQSQIVEYAIAGATQNNAELDRLYESIPKTEGFYKDSIFYPIYLFTKAKSDVARISIPESLKQFRGKLSDISQEINPYISYVTQINIAYLQIYSGDVKKAEQFLGVQFPAALSDITKHKILILPGVLSATILGNYNEGIHRSIQVATIFEKTGMFMEKYVGDYFRIYNLIFSENLLHSKKELKSLLKVFRDDVKLNPDFYQSTLIFFIYLGNLISYRENPEKTDFDISSISDISLSQCLNFLPLHHLFFFNLKVQIANQVDKILLAQLDSLISETETMNSLLYAIWLKVLKSAALLKHGEQESSFRVLMEIWDIAEPAGIIHPFISERELFNSKSHGWREAIKNKLPKELYNIFYFRAARQKEPFDTQILCELSSREQEVLILVKQGLTNLEISQRLYVSVGTIKWHLGNIFQKLHVKNRIQAVRSATEFNLL